MLVPLPTYWRGPPARGCSDICFCAGQFRSAIFRRQITLDDKAGDMRSTVLAISAGFDGPTLLAKKENTLPDSTKCRKSERNRLP
ncbi:hypothetical protein J6590_032953 [Homalodisca vitripennis]|nr:hypothetical protein J6590_032953 [Homalodisca vitripennis]